MVCTRFRAICGILMFAVLPLASAAGADELPILTIADHDWPPFLFAGTEDQPKGIIKELLEICLPEAGFEPDFRFYPINRVFAYVKSGRLDLNVMSRSTERTDFAHFGEAPIFTSVYVPFVRVESDIKLRSLADFDGLRLGHLAGLRYSPEYLAYVEGRIDKGSVVTAPSQESLIKMLLADHIDIFVLPAESLAWHAKQLGLRDKIRAVDFVIRQSDYYVTVSRKSEAVADAEALLRAVDACIIAAKADGRHVAIMKSYGIGP